jgi:hypothetical protein
VPRKIGDGGESCNTGHAGGNGDGGGRTEDGGKIQGVEGSGSGCGAERGGVDGRVGEVGEGGRGEGEDGVGKVDETEEKISRRDPGTQTTTQTETETGEGGGKGGLGGGVYGRLAELVRGVWNALACRVPLSVIKSRSDGVEGKHPEEGEGGGWRAEGRGEGEVEEGGLRMEAQLTGRSGASGKFKTLLQNNTISCGTIISCGAIQIGRSGAVGTWEVSND